MDTFAELRNEKLALLEVGRLADLAALYARVKLRRTNAI
jgi:hypothetical protein